MLNAKLDSTILERTRRYCFAGYELNISKNVLWIEHIQKFRLRLPTAFLVSFFDNLRGISKIMGPKWHSWSLVYHHQHCFMDIQSLYSLSTDQLSSLKMSESHTNVKPWSWVFPLIISSFSITSSQYFLSESYIISTS